ncbi:MAG: CHASE2 domain-containing protein [Phormidesmis sp. RL_2_1]|nr:CHASE2 domain-containing protein [Phormidesmis sp. RL_2_1]
MNYRANQPGQKISSEQIISNNFDPQMLQDRVVLLGYNAPVSKDYFATPYGPMPGLWVHAHMVSQMLAAVLDERPLIQTLPQWGNWQWGDMLWILSWSCLGGYVSWVIKGKSAKGKNMLKLWLLMVMVGALLLYITCWLAMIAGLWLPLVPSALAALGSTVGSHVGHKAGLKVSRDSHQPQLDVAVSE